MALRRKILSPAPHAPLTYVNISKCGERKDEVQAGISRYESEVRRRKAHSMSTVVEVQ